jgi:hypothetical protein
MPRLLAKQHYRLRQVAATALFALASSPSAASFSSCAINPSTTSSLINLSNSNNNYWGIVRGGTTTSAKRSESSVLTMSTTAVESDTTTTAATTDSMTPASKLEALRSKMKELNLDVYLIPSDDPHLSGKCLLFVPYVVDNIVEDIRLVAHPSLLALFIHIFRIRSRSVYAPQILDWLWRKCRNRGRDTNGSVVVGGFSLLE